MRASVTWGALGVLVICSAALLWHFRGQSPKAAALAPEQNAAQAGAPVAPQEPRPARSARVAVSNSNSRAAAVPGTSVQSAIAPVSPASIPPIAVDPAMGALVSGLKQLSGTNVALSAEAVGAWRTNLTQLVQSGPAAVPALRAFLNEKTDASFTREVAQATGYNSARLAAIDALRQIGGPEAVGAMEGLLGTTQSPREIATLARNLEEAQPGQDREQALAAARGALQAAAQSRDPNLDVAPLFEVFQHYGDASAIPDLEGALGTWKYYATIALADLPDGAGIPAILRMADPATGSGNRIVALEMVAQLAPNNPGVRDFLLAQASANQIPPNVWPYLTSPLSGDQYFPVDSAITTYPQLQSWSDVRTTRINSGNQNLYMLPGYQSLSADELNARLALVDDLARVANDPAAVRTLQQVRETLSRRSSRVNTQAQVQTQIGTGQ